MDYGASNAFGRGSPVHDLSGAEPSVVTFSHDHPDHRRPGATFTSARVLAGGGSLTLDGMTIRSIQTSEESMETPDNASFVILYGGFRVLHLADAQAYIAAIDDPVVKRQVKTRYPDNYDLVFMTIDGRTEIAGQAAAFLDLLSPARAIPMHYWSGEAKSDFLAEVERINRQGRGRSQRFTIAESGGSDFSLNADSPAFGTRVISLEPSPLVLSAAESLPFQQGAEAVSEPEVRRPSASPAGHGRTARIPARPAAPLAASRQRSAVGVPPAHQPAAVTAASRLHATAGSVAARRPVSPQLPSRGHQSVGAHGSRDIG